MSKTVTDAPPIRKISRTEPKEKKKKPIDWTLLITIIFLLVIGLVMLFSASYASGFHYMEDSYYYISKQILFAGAGVVVMLIVSQIPYKFYQKYVMIFYGIAFFLNLIPIAFSARSDGFRRWFLIPGLGITVQPSEIAKIAIILILASKIVQNGSEGMKKFKEGLIYPGLFVLPFIGVFLIQSHLSATVIIAFLALFLLVVGGLPMRFVLPLLLGAILVFYLIVKFDIISYATTRIQIMLDPFSLPKEGYQTRQSLYAISSGGPFGLGFGNSRQKYLYLPEPQNDFIFAIIAEELGFVGCVPILILYVVFLVRGYYVAIGIKDLFGKLVAVGIVTQVGIQTLFNVMVVTNLMPNTGISLPFISSGGTSLLVLLAEIGILLNISKYSTSVKMMSNAALKEKE